MKGVAKRRVKLLQTPLSCNKPMFRQFVYISVYKNLLNLMKKLTLFFAFCLLAATPLFAQTKDNRDVSDAVEFMRKAMIDGDRSRLTQVAADDLSYGHSSGKIQDKKEFVEAIASGASDFVTIDLTQQTIKVSGNTAIVRHVLSAQTNDGGKPGSVQLGILLIFQKQKGAWKLLARQAYKLPVQ